MLKSANSDVGTVIVVNVITEYSTDGTICNTNKIACPIDNAIVRVSEDDAVVPANVCGGPETATWTDPTWGKPTPVADNGSMADETDTDAGSEFWLELPAESPTAAASDTGIRRGFPRPTGRVCAVMILIYLRIEVVRVVPNKL